MRFGIGIDNVSVSEDDLEVRYGVASKPIETCIVGVTTTCEEATYSYVAIAPASDANRMLEKFLIDIAPSRAWLKGSKLRLRRR